MKIDSLLVLVFALAANLFAQEAPAPSNVVSQAPQTKTSHPLSKATLDKIAAMTPLFDGKTLDGWIESPVRRKSEVEENPKASWIVKDGVMASTGAGRGVIYTKDDYTNYRIIFDMRQVSGNHQPCVLIFCTRPAAGEKGLDALGGIQFQVPNGGHWDYRPGFNKSGSGFTNPIKTKFNNHEWSQVEILVNAKNGTARMAVAQPIGTKGIENLAYANTEAGKTGPFALQMHNAGLFDEYKDLRIELDPKEDKLITAE